MHYKHVVKGTFIKRINRFLCEVAFCHGREFCHVPNTSRLLELFLPGVPCICVRNDNPKRKTQFTIIQVKKKGVWVNIDSQVPNLLMSEYLVTNPGAIGLKPSLERQWKREYRYKHSRFDIAYRDEEQWGLIEVKGVTLEENTIAQFPGAPTTRGSKHIRELIDAKDLGYETHLIFCVQVPYATKFTVARHIDPVFAAQYDLARASGVFIHAFRCGVDAGEIWIDRAIPCE